MSNNECLINTKLQTLYHPKQQVLLFYLYYKNNMLKRINFITDKTGKVHYIIRIKFRIYILLFFIELIHKLIKTHKDNSGIDCDSPFF